VAEKTHFYTYLLKILGVQMNLIIDSVGEDFIQPFYEGKEISPWIFLTHSPRTNILFSMILIWHFGGFCLHQISGNFSISVE
jgi:hypothetical protein